MAEAKIIRAADIPANPDTNKSLINSQPVSKQAISLASLQNIRITTSRLSAPQIKVRNHIIIETGTIKIYRIIFI